MSRYSTLIAIAAAALCFTSLGCHAGTVPVSVPSTELATRSSDLIERAVRALLELEGESRVTRLWVFPTGDAQTVFVHYRTSKDPDAHEPGPTVEHLVMLEMNGERIAQLHDLTQAPESLLASVKRDPPSHAPIRQ